jgi:glutaminyl-peptide cyclotransferase
VVKRYPHPGQGFTQGLIVGTGAAREIAVWESTGLYGQSALCRYRLGHLQPQQRTALPAELFGEGICRVGAGAHIWQLTWQERVALRWDARTLELLDRVPYNREGWGICDADGYVVTSDGSSELVRRDPGTLSPLDVIHVRLGGERLLGLNDLTFAAGRVWANVAGTHFLAGVDLGTGEVTDIVDARHARERHIGNPQAIMNGVAALPAAGEFLLTGKTWRAIRHVRVVPTRLRASRLDAIRDGLSV